MKKLASLVFVSMLGGAITLGAYVMYFQDKSPIVQTQQEQPNFIPANFVKNPVTSTAAASGVDFTIAAEKTVHAVVHVQNKTSRSVPTNIIDLFYGRGQERTEIGTGSGVIISPDGYIITNNHVIAGSNELQVTLNDNKTYIAELVGTDTDTDIALLKIEADGELPHMVFGDSDATKIGEWVLAVGNPFNLTSTVTAGIISAKARDLNDTDDLKQSFLQTDAAVNPGNSGGALVNTKGELIGINTAITSQTGSFIGYSFAVPSNIARKVIEDLLEYGDVQRGLLGVAGGALNGKSAQQIGTTETEGFYVGRVTSGSGAENAGIQSGDIIKKIDHVKISKFSDLSGYLNSKRPGDVVQVTVHRDNDITVIPVTLTKEVKSTAISMMNMKLQDLTSEELEKADLDSGLRVIENRNSQLYHELGIKPGYILVEINNKKIGSAEDLKRYIDVNGENSIRVLAFKNLKGEYERFIFQ